MWVIGLITVKSSSHMVLLCVNSLKPSSHMVLLCVQWFISGVSVTHKPCSVNTLPSVGPQSIKVNILPGLANRSPGSSTSVYWKCQLDIGLHPVHVLYL